MRVAEDGLAQHAQMLVDLRLRVEAPSGVIEIDVTVGVEAPVLRRAELVEHGRLREGRVSSEERGLRLWPAGREEPLLRWSRDQFEGGAHVRQAAVWVAGMFGTSHAPWAQIS